MSENPKNILIVDDDENIRNLLKIYLEAHEYTFEEAGSGESAVEIFTERQLQHGFDLVIFDQVMLGMDGVTTFSEIQKVDGRLPAIMLTAFPTINLAIRFIQLGGINFLTKPFDPMSGVLSTVIFEAMNYKRIMRDQVTAEMKKSKCENIVFQDESHVSEVLQFRYDFASWKVLIVDDDEAIHAATRLVLEKFVFDGRAMEFHSAYSANEAITWLDANPAVALVLVDTVIETEFAGFDVIKHIRNTMGNRLIRIILRIEHAGELPEQKVVLDHDIDGFLPKEDISIQRFTIMVTTVFRAYRDLLVIEKQRQDSVEQLRLAHCRIAELESQLSDSVN